MEITIDNVTDLMSDAVSQKNEATMKKLIIASIDFFITNTNFTVDNLDEIASIYLHLPIEEKWPDEFNFKDRKLRYVLEELSAIEEKNIVQAKKIATRCKLYLEEKEY